MKPTFNLWSQNNPDALSNICPELGLRDWNKLNEEEKKKIWAYFVQKKWFDLTNKIYYSVESLNEKYKRKSYGTQTLDHQGPHYQYDDYKRRYFEDCCLKVALRDFYTIFLKENQDVVFELLSIFADLHIDTFTSQSVDDTSANQNDEEIANEAYKKLDDLSKDFNDIFEQFSLNVMLTRRGIIFRQDKHIMEEIYLPVISYLSSKKWKEVNRDFSDALNKFQEKTPQGYSGCITHLVSALQAFLQILVHDKVGKGEIGPLIIEAQKKNLIPNDSLTTKIFKDIQSILMEERQKSGDPHPKKEYANEKTSKLIMNLIMVFIQHCIIN
jgi:hypothetical protein